VIQTIADALAQQGYDTLTAVQQAVTDPALAEADLLVSAQTGSGKTVGFGLAIAPTLLGADTHFGPGGAPLALAIAPTRELALQVARELSWLYGPAGARVVTCVGGMDARTERRALERGAHVVVATPGRLCDHIKRGGIDLSAIRAVVLDEADEMLDLGFREELEFILSEAPEDRRTLLFSATVPAAIERLAKSYQRDAQRIVTQGETRQHADITYRGVTVHPSDTDKAIINLLRLHEARNAIVFCNTRAAVTRLTTRLTNRGFSVVALSGELTQSERSNALQALRDGRARVCVATDVAARGIDLPDLELVIHYDLPSNSETLLHRSGRTGRAGRKGTSALIVPPKLRGKANRLIGGAKLSVDWIAAPSAEEVMRADEERLLADGAWEAEVPEEAEALVANLTDRFTPRQLAAAFVNLHRARASAPEELNDPDAPPEARAPFGAAIWFAVSRGRDDGAEPRNILPMLCNQGGLTKDDIGRIRVMPKQSLVEVLATSVPKLEATLGAAMTLEEGVRLTRHDGPVESPRGARPPRRDDRPKPPRKSERPERGPRPERREDPVAEAPATTSSPSPAPTTSPAPAPAAAPERPRAKKVWNSDAPSDKLRKPRAEGADRPRKPRAEAGGEDTRGPRGDKPFKPKGDRPYKARDGKPGEKPFKPREGKPGDKPFKAKPGKPGDRPFKPKDGKPGDRPFKAKDGKPGGKPRNTGTTPAAEGAGEQRYNRAADPSKRFTPPNKRGKLAPKGGDATPRRGKPGPRGK
jgi:ATP-dependent RNA helicase DeaD